MIIGSLKDTQRIASFHPLFKTLFDFLANNDLSNIQLGKTELLKNKLYHLFYFRKRSFQGTIA